MNASRRAVGAEVLLTTLGVLLLIRLIVSLGSGVMGDLPLALVPVLFMWVPVWVLRKRGVDPDIYPLSIPTFAERDVWIRALRWSLGLLAAIALPFVGAYHLWQTWIFPEILTHLCQGRVPGTCALALQMHFVQPQWRWEGAGFVYTLARLLAYHVLFVAIPEELYYRGYVQSRLDGIWPASWRVVGARVGPSLLVTSLLFALGHSAVTFQWWHIFIVFPSLIFGWLREKTDHVLAGAFFHAGCNIGVGILDMIYELSPV